MNDVQERTLVIVKKQLQDTAQDTEIGLESDLSSIGLNSVIFIKIVVDLENEFDIEFANEDLEYGRFKNINDICDYISNKFEKA